MYFIKISTKNTLNAYVFTQKFHQGLSLTEGQF